MVGMDAKSICIFSLHLANEANDDDDDDDDDVGKSTRASPSAPLP
jgi:hypothetical protein